MNSSHRRRRFEFLLPVRFNDGALVPTECFVDTLYELRQRFGAVTMSTVTVRGEWQYKGKVYQDESITCFLDVPDTKSNWRFFVRYKQRLKKRFKQLDIWMTTYPVAVI